jgi:ribosomal protein S18 acetylase RimI-like enzyme
MNVRRARPEDLPTVQALWLELMEEIPAPSYEGEDTEQELAQVAEIVGSEVALLAEGEDGVALGLALAKRRWDGYGTLTDLYVRPDARRRGIATALVHAVLDALRERGIEHLDLEVTASNALARTVYARWGLRDEVVVMTGSLADLERRLGPRQAGSFGSIHVQSDDLSAVEQAVRQFVPRLPGGSRGSLVAPPRNGWIAVYDDVCDRDPRMLRRLARELSDRLGAVVLVLGLEHGDVVRMILLERGRVLDEYLSVPEFHGPLPPGDVVGLQANPTVVSRLTGADPDSVRRVARTAPTPAELPPAPELLASLAEVLGVEGAGHGFADAPALAGSVRIERR